MTPLIDLNALNKMLLGSALAPHACEIVSRTQQVLSTLRHGDYPRWQQALGELPALENLPVYKSSLCTDTISIEFSDSPKPEQTAAIEHVFRELVPWRKGPFRIGELQIETEWRSDWKWNRLSAHMGSLQGCSVLDVGCGSGYHAWRMRGAGADTVIGIDPTLLFNMQFQAVQHFVNDVNVHLLPLQMEEFPAATRAFDKVFSMGVLYHRRNALDHLRELHDALKPGAQLILETLIIDDPSDIIITPANPEEPAGDSSRRYARMRNVWAVPSVSVLTQWLENCGFNHIELISSVKTTTEEQRTTEWMPFESLMESLAAENPSKTVEGWPAPHRAILLANSSES